MASQIRRPELFPIYRNGRPMRLIRRDGYGLSSSAQVVDYLQSTAHVDSYLQALGTNAAGPGPGKPDMAVFANDRAYTKLFDNAAVGAPVPRQRRNDGALIDLVKHGIEPNPVTDVLFSRRNVRFLQHKCIEAIHRKTGYLIEPQGEDQLAQIMLTVFNTIPLSSYDRDVRAGVSYLNSFILNIFIEYVQRSLVEYLEYRQFVEQGVVPIDRPLNMNIKGTKTLLYTNTLVDNDGGDADVLRGV